MLLMFTSDLLLFTHWNWEINYGIIKCWIYVLISTFTQALSILLHFLATNLFCTSWWLIVKLGEVYLLLLKSCLEAYLFIMALSCFTFEIWGFNFLVWMIIFITNWFYNLDDREHLGNWIKIFRIFLGFKGYLACI